jgi:hypothetical protein
VPVKKGCGHRYGVRGIVPGFGGASNDDSKPKAKLWLRPDILRTDVYISFAIHIAIEMAGLDDSRVGKLSPISCARI